MMHWFAQWIWVAGDRRPHNQTIEARRTFELPAAPATATLAITADSRYRLYLNGQWVEDGPCRSWPQHYQYDVLDVTPWLRPGRNEIVVVARHFGLSTFHQVPQEAGLLAQLEVETVDGQRVRVATDETWQARVSPAHVADTVRISIQMAQAEWHDARLIPADDTPWPQAVAYYPAEGGPWQDLHPRDVRFLTREPISPVRVTEVSVVTQPPLIHTFDLKCICFPENRQANAIPVATVLATVVEAAHALELPFTPQHGWCTTVRCRGQEVTDGVLRLQPGANLVTLVVQNTGHLYDTAVCFGQAEGFTLCNPQDAVADCPWAVAGPFIAEDEVTRVAGYPGMSGVPEAVLAEMAHIAAATDAAELVARAGARLYTLPREVMLPRDSYLSFAHRRVVRRAPELVTDPQALLADNPEFATITHAADGDVELCLDLGKEVVGWVEFELIVPAGTVVDAHLIEYREGDRLQHTGHRNGFRYIAHEGVNRFVSFQRRAGRYLFLTLRDMTGPVRVRLVRVLQATYPVEMHGAFRCADMALDRIWEISAYTLRLCMEDTFTDCPLYEQTLWVGDARNEGLYNAICYGADDLALRCLRLTAQSLDHLSITGCQVPSGWDILLPAWSFLWGIQVWDYYLQTGDRAALEELYPAVMQNLRGAQAYCTDRGLFSIAAWNLFDWAPIDDGHNTVLHNSLFLVGALDAALQCADTLGTDDGAWLRAFRQGLVDAILPLWDTERDSYPDSIHADGTVSEKTSQHTSALAYLYDVLPPGAEAAALRNLTDPPADMTRVGSPFALQYVMEALEKAGMATEAVGIVRSLWQGMLDADATTCWETFPNPDSHWPTRSHCHAWSSAPIYVFNRLILGIVPVAPGASEVVVSPHPVGLPWARGASASPHGGLQVAWRVEDDTLAITVEMPAAVAWRVEPNADWAGFARVTVNGEEMAITHA